jgi:ABC-type multidrug transport system fused ATPase/permease subunit
VTGAAVRGLRNPFRSRLRAGVVVVLLALVTGLLALMVQAALASRDQIARLDARVRTLVELREAGAFGTGGFGGDKPVGEHDFSVDTLERLRRIPSAGHLAKIEEYVYTPQVDPTRPNAYAMVIGTPPGAAMRAIGEVDYENARIIAGRALRPEDARARVAVVGRLYARQRLGIAEPGSAPLSGQPLRFGGQAFQVVGVYTTWRHQAPPQGPGDDPCPRRIDLEVAEKGMVAIVGASGSGKSSLLHVIGAMDRPSSGQLRVAGQDLNTLPEAALTRFRRQTVGFVFQAFNLIPNLTAVENVMLPMEFNGVPTSERRRRAGALLNASGSASGSVTGRGSSRAANSSGSRSRGRWPMIPPWSSPTSPRGTSTRRPAS